MLGDKTAMATLAVKDMGAAKKFYEDKLGLEKDKDEPGGGGVMYKGGVFVYESSFAGTNQATACTWGVGKDIEKVVAGLKAKGVEFEHYDMPGIKRDGDIHLAGKIKAAWFKDPDGNIHSLVDQM